jgi:acetyl esterase/lipase
MKTHAVLILLVLITSCNNVSQKNSNQNYNKNSTTIMNTSSTDNYTRTEVIYGRTYSTALTMDVFAPKANTNGLAIVLFISEGWYSDHSKIEYNIPIYINTFVAKGYTVFAVVHGSNPKFSLLENVAQAKRAVKYIRYNAAKYGINPNKIGATGDSAGAHLSLMMGSSNTTIDYDADANDPVDKESYNVQAIAAFYPPTDFLNWGTTGNKMLGKHPKVPLMGAFSFYSLDSITNALQLITNQQQIETIARQLSPLNVVHKQFPPTLIVYGNKDSFIPIQQSQLLAAKLTVHGITHTTIVEQGGEHDALTITNNINATIAWFNTHLK